MPPRQLCGASLPGVADARSVAGCAERFGAEVRRVQNTIQLDRGRMIGAEGHSRANGQHRTSSLQEDPLRDRSEHGFSDPSSPVRAQNQQDIYSGLKIILQSELQWREKKIEN